MDTTEPTEKGPYWGSLLHLIIEHQLTHAVGDLRGRSYNRMT